MSTFPLTIVIPVHELTEETTPLFKEALASAINQKGQQAELIAVAVAGDVPELETTVHALIHEVTQGKDSPKVRVLLNDQQPVKSDIATQINLVIPHVATLYVTFLELDDQLGDNYVSEMAAHTEAIPEVDGWLPLAVCVDDTMHLLKYGNEAIWVPKTEEVRPDGFVDAETTEVSPDLLLSGTLFKTTVFTDGYGLKSNIKLTFVNEFFRRVVARGAVLRGMGKALYMHRERRPGSYQYELMVGEQALTQDDATYWLGVARAESAFEVERPLTR